MKAAKPLHNRQGFTLIEVLVSFALVVVIFAATISSLTRASQWSQTNQHRITARKLARNELTRLKNQGYEQLEVRDYSDTDKRLLLDAGESNKSGDDLYAEVWTEVKPADVDGDGMLDSVYHLKVGILWEIMDRKQEEVMTTLLSREGN